MPPQATRPIEVTIVGGCGHVGLPLGIALAEGGASVTLLDIDAQRVRHVQEGHMPFVEYGAEEALPRALASGRLRATTDSSSIGGGEVVVVTIGTPIDEYLDPSVRSFDEAIDNILRQMRDGQLLILRSTLFPGVTDRLSRQLAASGRQVDLAHCPERIAQAYALEELASLPQIVGGTTPSATRRSAELFALLGVEIVELPPLEAEFAKLFANAYRYINFAIANQFYLIAEQFGADFDRIRAAVMHRYPRLAGFARAGYAGGPCLLKDTMQLASFNHNGFALGHAAMMVNEGLPYSMVEAARRQYGLRGKKAGILGMAFKPNCDDARDSLSYKLRKILRVECREVLCTDPYIDDPTFLPLETVLAEADIVFIGAAHDEYQSIVTDRPVIDFHSAIWEIGQHESTGHGLGGVHRRIPRRRAA